MSQQGPIIVVSATRRPPFASALDEAKLFPVIETIWADASRAVEQMQPAAVLVALPDAEPGFGALAKQIAAREPYLPLIAIDPSTRLPQNGLPHRALGGAGGWLVARLCPAKSRNHLRRARADRRQCLAVDPSARLRGAFEPYAALDRRRRLARSQDRPVDTGGIQPRFCYSRLSNAVARRRIVGGTLCLRSGPCARAARRRADSQPFDAANGFWRRRSGWIGHRGIS